MDRSGGKPIGPENLINFHLDGTYLAENGDTIAPIHCDCTNLKSIEDEGWVR